jgi:uncharacterized protein (DUF302 family)
MSKIPIGHRKDLPATSFESAYAQVLEAMTEEGFGALTEIDVKATLKKKLDADFRPYTIIGACHPPSAYEVLKEEPEVGLLLPCNIVVESDGQGGSIVWAIDARSMFTLVDNPRLQHIAADVDERLQRVLEAVQ